MLIKKVAFILSLVSVSTLVCTGCNRHDNAQGVATLPLTNEEYPVAVESTDTNKTTETTAETTFETTAETTAETTMETASENAVTTSNYTTQDIENWTRNFAHSLYTDIVNTDVNAAVIIPISTEHEISTFDVEAMLADIIFMDVNYDGVPEFFAGGHGTMGSGRYSVYDVDGNCYGTEIFTWDLLSFETDGQTMYAPIGSNSTPGHVVLKQGLPQIYANGFAYIDGTPTDVIVKTTSGATVNTTVTTSEEFEKLYQQYLNVDCTSLHKISEETNYVRDYLRVPNPEDYTEDDIYACLLPLINAYVLQ